MAGETTGTNEFDFDVLVIGCGFGGSITACRLAQAGRRVGLLERGRRWDATDFPRSPTEIADGAFWNPDEGEFGLLDYLVFPGMHVIQGSGVGGGSLHYFNVHIRPPASIFDDPRWPKEITAELLDPYYRLARDMLDAAPFAPPAGRSLPRRTEVFNEACRRSGREPEPIDIAVHTGASRANAHSGTQQNPCDYSGACGLGCAAHAKNTLDLNYLAIAERHQAVILPLHEAQLIEPITGGGYRVEATVLGPSPPGSARPKTFTAKTVVVSAGTLGTNRLLLRRRDHHQTLPALSAALGTGFSGNGDLLLAGASTDQDIDASRGPSITTGVDVASDRQQAYVEDLGVPEVMAWFIEGFLANLNPLRNLLRFAKLVVQDRLGIQGATDRLIKERRRLLAGSRTRTFLPFLGMCEDAADGTFGLGPGGELRLDWNIEASLPNFLELEAELRRLSDALGAEYVASPLWVDGKQLLTAHPLGGCRMGSDPATCVTDARGEVHGYPGLFVADGSLVPTALARNPSATISALSERVAFWILHQRELTGKADPAWPSNAPPRRAPRATAVSR